EGVALPTNSLHLEMSAIRLQRRPGQLRSARQRHRKCQQPRALSGPACCDYHKLTSPHSIGHRRAIASEIAGGVSPEVLARHLVDGVQGMIPAPGKYKAARCDKQAAITDGTELRRQFHTSQCRMIAYCRIVAERSLPDHARVVEIERLHVCVG